MLNSVSVMASIFYTDGKEEDTRYIEIRNGSGGL